MHLGILAPNRGSELTDFDINLMGKSKTTYIFRLSSPPKNFKKRKKSEPIEFRKFEGDRKLCPYQTLTEYIKVTERFREKQQTSKLCWTALASRERYNGQVDKRDAENSRHWYWSLPGSLKKVGLVFKGICERGKYRRNFKNGELVKCIGMAEILQKRL